MKAILGCALEDKPGSWFVQLRTPHTRLLDQRVISSCWGATRDDAIATAMAHGGVTEIVAAYPEIAQYSPRGIKHPSSFYRRLFAIAAAVR